MLKSGFLFLAVSCLVFLFSSQSDAAAVVIDNFDAAADGPGAPKGWELKENTGKAAIKIEKENGNKVLHMSSKGTSFILTKEFPVDLKKYPIVSWRWKVTALPKGGDIRKKDTDDQAAQIYMHFAKFPKKVNFWEIGYIWDSTAPAGTIAPSPQMIGSKVQYLVLQSGPAKLNQWVTERRNVYEDHKKLFGEEPPELSGVGIMINTNRTNSSAELYFDDFKFEQK